MAKGNLFLGQARGKVGSVVFSRAFGQQITRTKPTSVANPKSYGQNFQRAILATIAKAAAAMAPIVDHSFAGVADGGDSTRYFRKINIDWLRSELLVNQTDTNITPKGGGFVPQSYRVSKGNLPSFECVATDGVNPIFVQGSGRLQDNADITAADFFAQYPYIQPGDQLTLVKIVKTSGSLRNDDAQFIFTADRIVLAPAATFEQLGYDGNLISGDTFNIAYLDMTKTTNRAALKVIGDAGSAGIGFNRAAGGDVYATALILSREVNGVWQRSTQYMTMLEQDDHVDTAAAIASYGASVSVSTDTEYLNQSNSNDQYIEGESGAYMLASWTAPNNLEEVDSKIINQGGQGSAENLEYEAHENQDAATVGVVAYSKGSIYPREVSIARGAGGVLTILASSQAVGVVASLACDLSILPNDLAGVMHWNQLPATLTISTTWSDGSVSLQRLNVTNQEPA